MGVDHSLNCAVFFRGGVNLSKYPPLHLQTCRGDGLKTLAVISRNCLGLKLYLIGLWVGLQGVASNHSHTDWKTWLTSCCVTMALSAYQHQNQCQRLPHSSCKTSENGMSVGQHFLFERILKGEIMNWNHWNCWSMVRASGRISSQRLKTGSSFVTRQPL